MNKSHNSVKRMLMNIKTFSLGALTLFLIVSCEDYLDVDQPDIIEQEQAFSDKNSTNLSIIGIYGLMAELVEPMFLAGEVRADLTVANKSAEAYIKEFSNNSFSASNPYVSPKAFYSIINNANDFIIEFEGLLADQKMDTASFRGYKGELIALRVWSQFQLAKIYGTVKYYTEEVDSTNNSPFTNYSYSDTSFMRLLINDLTYADTITYTPTNERTVWQTVRISDYYVNALMAELYMEMGDFETAIDKFEEVTKIGDRLNYNRDRWNIKDELEGSDWFYELYFAPWESSLLINNAVFMIAFDSKFNQHNELRNWTDSYNYQVAPTDGFVQQFEAHAISVEDEYDYRVYSIGSSRFGTTTSYRILKYMEEDRPLILTRTARLHLLKAYCLNLTDDSDKAIKEINELRKRIDFESIDTDEMPEDENALVLWVEDLIMDELAYENAFEGERWYDLMRVANRRNDPAYLANRVAEKYPDESRDQIRAKLMNKANWFIPVFE